MKAQPTYRLLFCLLAVAGFVSDQAQKYGVFAWLREAPGYKHEVIPGVFDLVAQHERDADGQLTPYVNRGALFGWLQGMGLKANTGFAIISLLAAAAILVWIRQRSTASDRSLCAALGLILGGTLGNLYDRVLFGGVRDFLHWKAPEWPVFNIADCCLVVGAGLLLIQAFRTQPKTEDSSLRVPASPEASVAQ